MKKLAAILVFFFPFTLAAQTGSIAGKTIPVVVGNVVAGNCYSAQITGNDIQMVDSGGKCGAASSATGPALWSLGEFGIDAAGQPFLQPGAINMTNFTHLSYRDMLVSDALGTIDTATRYVSTACPSSTSGQTCAQDLVAAGHTAGKKVLIGIMQSSNGNFAGSIANHLAAFVANIMTVVNTYNFDGVEVDWEGDWSCSTYNTDMTNFLNSLRTNLGTKLIIEDSVANDSTQYSCMNNYKAIVDKYFLETYDDGNAGNPYSWFNAPIIGPTSQAVWSQDLSRSRIVTTGIPASQMLLGIPMYGYTFTNVTGPRQSGAGWNTTTQTGKQYNILANTYNLAAATYDTGTGDGSNPQVPWLYTGSLYITFDNPQSVAAKVAYAKANAMGGWGVWHLQYDYCPTCVITEPLVNALGPITVPPPQQGTVNAGTTGQSAYYANSTSISGVTLTNGKLTEGSSTTGVADADLSGDVTTSGTTTTTVAKVNGVSYPASPSTNTVPVVTSSNTVTYQNVVITGGNTVAGGNHGKCPSCAPAPTTATVGGIIGGGAANSASGFLYPSYAGNVVSTVRDFLMPFTGGLDNLSDCISGSEPNGDFSRLALAKDNGVGEYGASSTSGADPDSSLVNMPNDAAGCITQGNNSVFPFVKGDPVFVTLVTGTVTGIQIIRGWSAEVVGSTSQPLFNYYAQGTVATNTTVYSGPGMNTGLNQGTETFVATPIPDTFTAQNLCISMTSAQGTQPLVLTLRKGTGSGAASDTALTVTVTASANTGKWCDTTDTVAFAAGDYFDWKLAEGNGAASGGIDSISMEMVPGGSNGVLGLIAFNNGATGQSITASTNNYFGPFGTYTTATTNESNFRGPAPRAFSMKNPYCYVKTAPANTATPTFLKNGSSTGVTVSVTSGGGTGTIAGSGTGTIAAKDGLDLNIITGAGAQAAISSCVVGVY